MLFSKEIHIRRRDLLKWSGNHDRGMLQTGMTARHLLLSDEKKLR